MNEVLIKRIEINKKVYRVPTLIHRLLKKDLKLLLFTKYNKNNELVFRDNIKVIEYEKTTLEKNKEYILKCENIILGKAKYIGNNTFKAISICIKNDIDKSIKDLFIDVNNDISDCKIEVYQKGLFRYYYDFLIQCLEDNNNYFFINKMTAISSYIVAKNFFKEKGCKVSQPNVFIRNFNVEFDMLLLDDKACSRKLVYEPEEVKSIIELKASGIVGYSKDIDNKPDKKYGKDYKNFFQAYITFDQNAEKWDKKLKEYDNDLYEAYVEDDYNTIKKEVLDIPYIYFCFYESNSPKNKAYECMYHDIKKVNNRLGLFLTVSDNQDYYTIPYDYDIKKLSF